MIRNFAVVGPGQATRERLTAALAAAPDMAVYRIGRGADPLPVSATFDPADQPGCRSLLDWFERGAPSGAVLLVEPAGGAHVILVSTDCVFDGTGVAT